jgi:hypothetical protein
MTIPELDSLVSFSTDPETIQEKRELARLNMNDIITSIENNEPILATTKNAMNIERDFIIALCGVSITFLILMVAFYNCGRTSKCHKVGDLTDIELRNLAESRFGLQNIGFEANSPVSKHPARYREETPHPSRMTRGASERRSARSMSRLAAALTLMMILACAVEPTTAKPGADGQRNTGQLRNSGGSQGNDYGRISDQNYQQVNEEDDNDESALEEWVEGIQRLATIEWHWKDILIFGSCTLVVILLIGSIFAVASWILTWKKNPMAATKSCKNIFCRGWSDQCQVFLQLSTFACYQSVRVFIGAILGPPIHLRVTGNLQVEQIKYGRGLFYDVLHVTWGNVNLRYQGRTFPFQEEINLISPRQRWKARHLFGNRKASKLCNLVIVYNDSLIVRNLETVNGVPEDPYQPSTSDRPPPSAPHTSSVVTTTVTPQYCSEHRHPATLDYGTGKGYDCPGCPKGQHRGPYALRDEPRR